MDFFSFSETGKINAIICYTLNITNTLKNSNTPTENRKNRFSIN